MNLINSLPPIEDEYKIERYMRERKIDYGDSMMNILFRGFMNAGLSEGIQIEHLQADWDKQQIEMNAPDYYEAGKDYDIWYDEFQKRNFEKINAASMQMANNEYIKRAIENAKVVINKLYPLYMKCLLNSWICGTEQHIRKKEMIKDIFNKDLIQFWYGQSGVGKTHLLVSVLKEYATRGKMGMIYEGDYLFDLFAAHVTENRYGERHTISKHISEMDKYYILMIDDYNPKAEKNSDFIISGIFNLIKHRINMKLRTIFVSNKNFEIIRMSFGRKKDVIERRINEHGKWISFDTIGIYNKI